MIGLLGFLEILKGVLQFPDAVLRMVRVFKKVPSENHDALLKHSEDVATKFEETGRPTWD